MVQAVGTPQTTDYGFSSFRDGVTLPSGLQSGDVVFFGLTTANAHTLGTIPAALTQIGTTQNAAADDSSTSILFLIADGTEGATYDLGEIFSAAESGGVLAFALRGLNTDSLIDAVSQGAIGVSAAGDLVTGPSVTSTSNGAVILQVIGCDPGVSAISATPDGSPVATELFDGKVDTGDWSYMFAQMYEQPTAGAISLDAEISYGPLSFSAFQIALNATPPGPSVSLTSGNLQPGGNFTLAYSNFAGTPTSPVTITDSNNNSITVAVTVNDNGDGTGTATGTMPSLPTSGSAAGLLFGDVTVELTT